MNLHMILYWVDGESIYIEGVIPNVTILYFCSFLDKTHIIKQPDYTATEQVRC